MGKKKDAKKLAKATAAASRLFQTAPVPPRTSLSSLIKRANVQPTKSVTTVRSPDMVMTTMRSMDNGVMRPAIAFHKREGIGSMMDTGQEGPRRYHYETTEEFDEWATEVLGKPGLHPRQWHNDPVWDEFKRRQADGDYRTMASGALFARDYTKEHGPRRMIVVLDSEQECLMFKMRWQDEPMS